MITQIYSIQTVEEALACIDAGADHLGLLPVQLEDGKPIPCGVPKSVCHDLLNACRGRAVLSFLSVNDDPQFYYDMASEYHPDIIHVTGKRFFVSEPFVKKIKELSPGTRVMQAVPMTGPEAVDFAKKYAQWADLLILDSVAPDHDEIGAAGVTHDWDLDRQIVESVDVPVIIAGGLGPDNVAAAIEHVRPWGVDSLTKTDEFLPDGTRLQKKDIAKVRAFCQAAKAAGR